MPLAELALVVAINLMDRYSLRNEIVACAPHNAFAMGGALESGLLGSYRAPQRVCTVAEVLGSRAVSISGKLSPWEGVVLVYHNTNDSKVSSNMA